MDEAALGRRLEGRQLRRRKRNRNRLLIAIGLCLLAVWVVALSNLAVTYVAPWVRQELAPFLEQLAVVERDLIKARDLPQVAPGVPLYPDARYDEFHTLAFWLTAPLSAKPQPGTPYPELPLVFQLRDGGSKALRWYAENLTGWAEDLGHRASDRSRSFRSEGRLLTVSVERRRYPGHRSSRRYLVLRYSGPGPGHQRALRVVRAVHEAFGRPGPDDHD